MKDSVSTAAAGALAELLEVSPQVAAAVIVERDGGSLVAATPGTGDRTAAQLSTTCTRILDAAEQARRELGREPIVQVEVGAPEGHVFVVADPTWLVAAVTEADPTVGLVFYDLKTSLRAVREATAAEDAPAATNGSAPISLVTSTGDEPDQAAPAPTEPQGTAAGDDGAEPAPAATPAPAPSATAESNGSTGSGRRWRRRNR
jgi:predicted regulator of Ras-like GTPase activity (Roadblock/LC7/MglB family)